MRHWRRTCSIGCPKPRSIPSESAATSSASLTCARSVSPVIPRGAPVRSRAGRALAAAVAVDVDDPESAPCVVCLPGCREQRAFRRGLAVAGVRDLEPALHGLGSREQLFDLAELAAGERAHLIAHAVRAV